MSRKRAQSLIAQGIAAAKAGDISRARLLLRQAVEIDPTYPEAWLWHAGVAENPQHAVSALERVLELDPKNKRAKAGLRVGRLQAGIQAAQANRRTEARAYLLQVTADDPSNEAAWLWLAGATDDSLEAIACLEHALQLNPANDRARAGIEIFRERVRAETQWLCPICQACEATRFATCPQCRAILDLARGDAAIANPSPNTEKIRQGADRLASEARQKPNFVSYYYLGMALLNLARPDEALPHFREALALKPGDAGLAAQVDTLEQALADAPPPTVRISAADREKYQETPGRLGLARKSILIVDDSPTIRKLVGMTLRKRGYRVMEAGDGREAIEVMQADGFPDLFVLDVTMPRMDGYTLCRAIRDNPTTALTPVIMLSDRDGFLDRMRGRMAGSNQYLTKPFQPDVLVNAVQDHCPLNG